MQTVPELALTMALTMKQWCHLSGFQDMTYVLSVQGLDSCNGVIGNQ